MGIPAPNPPAPERLCCHSQMYFNQGAVLPSATQCLDHTASFWVFTFHDPRDGADPQIFRLCTLLLIRTWDSQLLSFSQSLVWGKSFSYAVPCMYFHSFSFSLSLLSAIRGPSPLQYPQFFSPPTQFSTGPTFQDVAVFLPLVVQFCSLSPQISWVLKIIYS